MIDVGADLQRAYDDGYAHGIADAMKWISSSERLPNHELAIVQYGDGDFDLLQFPTAYRRKDIVAWLSLPEPYKGEKHE